MGLDPDQYEAGVEQYYMLPIFFSGRVLRGVLTPNQCFAWAFLVKINDTKIRPILN